MRLAALYDIHGNLPALEAVLEDIYREKVDCLVVGGDVVAGPMPRETLTLFQEVTILTHFIHGNAESEVLKRLAGEDTSTLPAHVNEVISWVAGQLTTEQKQFLASWVATRQLGIDGWGDVLFCHATPQNDTDVFTRLTPEEKLLPIFGDLTVAGVVCGHTHMQFDRTISGVRVVNAGSVGMPFGKTGADWLLLDDGVEFRHTNYNRLQAAERIRQTEYPQAEDFAANNVLNAPSEAEALAVFTKMELNRL